MILWPLPSLQPGTIARQDAGTQGASLHRLQLRSTCLDRLVAILGGQETIRDFIAFPKNNAGRDVMIDAPAPLDNAQLKELNIKLDL